MPRPVYIICAESTSQDARNGLMSLFHILEGYTLRLQHTEEPIQSEVAQAKPTFFGVAVWARTTGDSPEQDFEYEMLCMSPASEEKPVKSGTFRFTKPHHRFLTGFIAGAPILKSGDFVFKHRIRRAGDSEWLSQEYRMPITVEISE